MLSKISPKMLNLGQSGPKNCDLLLSACSKFAPKSIHQIVQYQFQKYKIFQLLRGHIPPQTPPCARKHAIATDVPPGHQQICQRQIYAPGPQPAQIEK